jgi:hypothetical protein
MMTQCPIIPNPKKGKWEVYSDYTYTTKAGMTIEVKKGFETDLASVPFLFRWFFPKCRVDYATASVVHDWLLEQGLGREYADIVFREILDKTTDEETEEIFYTGVFIWSRMKRWLGGQRD